MRDAAIAINEPPLPGQRPNPVGLRRTAAARLLSAVSKLTVYGPDGFSKTYTSEEKTDDR